MRGLTLSPDATLTIVEVESLEDFQSAVGGNIEAVLNVDDEEKGFLVYVNEDGWALDLKFNPGATAVVESAGISAHLLGTALFVGPNETDLSDKTADYIKQKM